MGKAYSSKGKGKGNEKGKGKGTVKRGVKSPRARVKKLTQQIIEFAKRRRLEDAKRVFKQIVEDEGLTPTLLTYSCMINAYVASGDMMGAERTFNDMQSAGIFANNVIYNTLFKGYCMAGNTSRSAALFDEMVKQNVKPDTNTVNAYLRGCLRAGDVDDAHAVFSKMTQQWDAEPDFFTYKRVVQILSRGLRLDAVKVINRKLRRMQKVHDGSFDSSGLLALLVWLELHMGLSAALLGEWLTSKRALQHVEEAGAAVAVAPEVHLLRNATDQSSASGDRGQHEFHRQMFQGEMERLREFLECKQVFMDDVADQEIPAPSLIRPFCRTFIFRAQTDLDRQDQAAESVVSRPTDKLAVELVRSLMRTFGLDVCVDHGLVSVASMESRFRKCLHDGRLCWQRVFKSKGIPLSELPVKLEICSGHGEWVVAQAKAESGIANWASLEIRLDRVHCTFSRMVFETVHNLCLLGGDAAQILPQYIMACTVDHIFVNFPEPPQTNMLYGAKSELHLLTKKFFKEMHQVLCTSGRITILSDEYKYCRLLARTVSALNHEKTTMFEPALGLRGRGRAKDCFEDIEGIRLYHGVPGKRSGHVVSSSSYFDRLWDTKERYFLVLVKR